MRIQRILLCAPLLGLMLLGGCDRHMNWSPVDMWNRSRYKPLEPEPFFADGSSSRQLPPGTVARGQFLEKDARGQVIIDETLLNGRKRGSGVISNYEVGNGVIEGANGYVATVDQLKYTKTPTVTHAVGENYLGEDASLATRFPFPVTQEVLNRGHERFDIYCSPCHGRSLEANGTIVQRGFPKPPSLHTARLVKAPVGHYFDVITHGYGAMYSYASRVEPRDRWAIIAYIRLLQKQAAGRKDVIRDDTPPGTRELPSAQMPPQMSTGAAATAAADSGKGVSAQ